MASRVLHHHVEAEQIDATTRSTKAYTGLLAGFRGFETTLFSRPVIDIKISRVETLHGAKGAMVAVGLEAAAALCLFGVWGIWQILR